MPATSPNAERLLRLARGGDADALGRLFEQYRSYLKLLTKLEIDRRLQGKADPSDLVQEAFLKANRGFGGFRGTSEPELLEWMRQILASVLTDFVRHYRNTQRRDVRLERDLVHELNQSSQNMDRALIDQRSSPSQQASNHEQGVLLARALEQLPSDYREVIVLRHLEGLTFPEIARRMKRSGDSVEKLWTRGLVRLRQVMRELP